MMRFTGGLNVFAIFLFAAALMSVSLGASVAEDPAKEYDETITNVTESVDEQRQQIYANTSGAVESVAAKAMLEPIYTPLFGAVETGYAIGHANPWLGPAARLTTPIALLVGMGYYVYRQISRVKQEAW